MRKPFFSGEPFERIVAILIAVITIIAAVAAFLEADAGTRSDTALRDAQQFALQAMGTRTRGEVQASYAWADAYRLWLEMDSQAFEAAQQGDAALAEHFTAARDRLNQVSPLLAPPYFDPNSAELPDINAYEADLYLVETTALAEHFTNKAAVSEAWDGKAGAYVTHLTLLTVALFLFGLSTTIVGRASWLFVGMGALIANVTVGWMVLTVLAPVRQLPDAAIAAYAQGVGLAYQDENARAVQALDQALALAPDYAQAHYERAKAYADLGDYEAAVADYEAAMAAGMEDVYTAWNLGWTLYLMGRFDRSIAMTERALALAPGQIALHYNLALAQLAKGDIDAAHAAYTTGSELAAQQVADAHAAGLEPPATLWWYLSASAGDLDNLLRCIRAGECVQAPPPASLTAPQTTEQMAAQVRLALKNLTAALEYSGAPQVEQIAASIDNVEFVEPEYNEAGVVAAYIPLVANALRLRGAGVFEESGEGADLALRRGTGVSEVFVSFAYEGIEAGELVVIKVYVDGREATGLRLVQEWTMAAQGEAVLPLTPGGAYALDVGEYTVEIYVDSHLLQTANFTIP